MASSRKGIRRAPALKARPRQTGNGISTFQAQSSLQRGYGMTGFRGAPLQRGHGIGGLFKGLFRIAVPIIRKSLAPIARRGLKAAAKSALKSAGKKALKASAYALKDVAEDKATLKEALKNRANEALNSGIATINTGARKRKSNTTVRGSKSKVLKNKKKKSSRRIVAPTL